MNVGKNDTCGLLVYNHTYETYFRSVLVCKNRLSPHRSSDKIWMNSNEVARVAQ